MLCDVSKITHSNRFLTKHTLKGNLFSNGAPLCLCSHSFGHCCASGKGNGVTMMDTLPPSLFLSFLVLNTPFFMKESNFLGEDATVFQIE